jgi:hypothetical protein
MILTELMLKDIIPKIGQRAKFINELEKLKILSSVSVNLNIYYIYSI